MILPTLGGRALAAAQVWFFFCPLFSRRTPDCHDSARGSFFQCCFSSSDQVQIAVPRPLHPGMMTLYEDALRPMADGAGR